MGQALLAVLFQLSEVLVWFFFLVERGWARPRSPPRAVNSRWHPRAGLRPSCTSRSPLAVLGCPGRCSRTRGALKSHFRWRKVQQIAWVLCVPCSILFLWKDIPVEPKQLPGAGTELGLGPKGPWCCCPSARPGISPGLGPAAAPRGMRHPQSFSP